MQSFPTFVYKKFVPLQIVIQILRFDMYKNILYLLLILVLSGCSEYQKALKSTDYNYKFDYAKRAFEEGKYVQASTLLSECANIFKASDKAEECLYLLGLSNYENKDYITSGTYFKSYFSRYPKGKFAEMARFYCGYGYYLESPDPQLDQTDTYQAIQELQAFLDYFPKSDMVPVAQQAIFELQDKLVLKQLQNAQLYYNLGTYRGNNYESAVIVARNAVKDYPYSKYKEDLEMLILKARFQEANLSINERKAERFREVIDEYYSFVNNFPDSKSRDEADNILKIAQKYVKD